MNLQWATPGHHGRGKRAGGDVSVCINKTGDKNRPERHSLVFRFTLEAANKIAPNSEYASYAYDAEFNRIYFAARDKSDGFKLSKKGKRRVLTSAVFDEHLWANFLGDYTIRKDAEWKLYYIVVPPFAFQPNDRRIEA